jgi:taurine dioxygenase
LHALEIPDHGGNTVFTDTHATYETLPDAAKKRIAGLRAEFSYGGNTRKKSTGMAANSLDKDGQENTTVTHPVV